MGGVRSDRKKSKVKHTSPSSPSSPDPRSLKPISDVAKWRSGFSQVNDKTLHSDGLKLRRSTIEGLLAPMTNLVKMLDALDTVVTEEEVLAIESKLMKLYRPSFPKCDRVTSDRTCECSLTSHPNEGCVAK